MEWGGCPIPLSVFWQYDFPKRGKGWGVPLFLLHTMSFFAFALNLSAINFAFQVFFSFPVLPSDDYVPAMSMTVHVFPINQPRLDFQQILILRKLPFHTNQNTKIRYKLKKRFILPLFLFCISIISLCLTSTNLLRKLLTKNSVILETN